MFAPPLRPQLSVAVCRQIQEILAAAAMIETVARRAARLLTGWPAFAFESRELFVWSDVTTRQIVRRS